MIRAELGNLDLVGECEALDTDYLFDAPEDRPASMPNRLVNIQLPRKLKFLLELHRFKVIHGGRGGGKSWAVADALLALGAAQKLRILCARESAEVDRPVRASAAQGPHRRAGARELLRQCSTPRSAAATAR
jgi:hypothetical protein